LVIGDPVFAPAFLEDLRRQRRPVPHQLPEAREEARRVAREFERLRDELAGLPPLQVESVVGEPLSVTELRERLRDGYHIVHFAGHGVFRRGDPETSAWLLSDGELWAREIRNTLAGQEEPPWLIFANACEAGMDAGAPASRYQGDVFGLATACINQGVAAYIAPLWPVQDVLAAELAADFYRELIVNRASVGEALRRAKVRARGDAGTSARRLAWASFVLYGDPTQQLLRTLWSGAARPTAKST
ncbi:MAG: CHAT domain-containing protein, partial [Zetaproteobacteria bacterium]